MKLGEKGEKLIKHYENLNDDDLTIIGYQPKMDCSSIWTAGWGHAIVYNNKFLKGIENKALAYSLYPNMDDEGAEKLFHADCMKPENTVNSQQLVLNQDMFDALVSFTFNCGVKAFIESTLLKRVRSKQGDIAEAFGRFNLSGGVVRKGLIYRRQTETHLFLTGELVFYN